MKNRWNELSDMLKKAEKLKDNFDVEIYLVLSITTKYKDLVNIAQGYEDINNWSIIFTKLDETCSLGNILNVRLLTVHSFRIQHMDRMCLMILNLLTNRL